MIKELRETSRLTVVTDDAHLRQAIDSVTWERRGLLQRLVRVDSRNEATVRRKGK
jgi:hypothetical protein